MHAARYRLNRLLGRLELPIVAEICDFRPSCGGCGCGALSPLVSGARMPPSSSAVCASPCRTPPPPPTTTAPSSINVSNSIGPANCGRVYPEIFLRGGPPPPPAPLKFNRCCGTCGVGGFLFGTNRERSQQKKKHFIRFNNGGYSHFNGTLERRETSINLSNLTRFRPTGFFLFAFSPLTSIV